MTHLCARLGCGNLVKRSTREYCSTDCAALMRRRATRSPCPRCGGPTQPGRIFCSAAHAHEDAREKRTLPPKPCPQCDRHVRDKKRKYCSTTCANRANSEFQKARHRGVRVVKRATEGPQPIMLRLREVYQWGFTLNLPPAKRGDIEAVSRAMQRAEPGHPGFARREQPSGFFVVRETSGVRL